MLVDIGACITQVALYEQGSLWQAVVVPLGGAHITNDLAVGLRTPIAQAEAIKLAYGRARGDGGDDILLGVPGTAQGSQRQVSRSMLDTIVEARVQEIMDLVASQLQFLGYPQALPAGVVLTGGTSALKGMVELAESRLDMPVRAGYPLLGGGLEDITRDPALATSAGLVMRALGQRETDLAGARDRGKVGSMLQGLLSWLRELL